MNFQDKINKIITILDTLFAKLPNATTQQQQEQITLADLVNKLKTEEIKELEALGTLGDTYLSEKASWLTKEAQLEKAKKDAEAALVTEKKKLSEDLVKKLADLAKSEETDPAKLAELKSLLADLKDKKTEAKLSETDRKELAKDLQKETPANYWAIAGCVFAGLACLIATGFGLFIRNSKE